MAYRHIHIRRAVYQKATTISFLSQNQRIQTVKTIIVVCGVILNEGKVLAAQRSATMSLPLKWEFPGGKLNPNESEEDGLKRELQEELNITVSLGKRLTPSPYDYGNIKIELIPIVGHYLEGKIILREHLQIGWFEAKELLALDWAPADLPIVQELQRLNNSYSIEIEKGTV
ncbi:MAG: (deoxy)nucleoside triphosphate pyrophosphohydrolase [Bacteroidetes bacterium]|nr:(deoxy)nucleoside triphosphate pyrophosphohydrolase [Bacteroidota bacterium]